MEEAALVLNKFGDGQSTLMDQLERLSVEARLQQAILGRSLSEPNTIRLHPLQAGCREGEPQEEGRKRRLGIGKVLMKLIKPFLGTRRTGNGKIRNSAVADYSKKTPSSEMNPIPMYSKAFSRSLHARAKSC